MSAALSEPTRVRQGARILGLAGVPRLKCKKPPTANGWGLYVLLTPQNTTQGIPFKESSHEGL